MRLDTPVGLTDTATGEIIDLEPLRKQPRATPSAWRPRPYKATRRRVTRSRHQDDAMFMLAAMTALLAAISLVA